MNSFRLFHQRTGRVMLALALLLTSIMPALAPTFVAAEQVTERSIALSSSSKAATGVAYTIDFTSDGAAGAFIVDFCSDSPIIGQTCTAPTGFSLSSATTATPGFTRTVLDANTIMLVGTITADDDVSVALANVTNPTAAGPLYARIITYDTDTNADDYVSTNLGTGNVDDGGVAISITDTVGVSGAVLESMTFCAAKIAITANCANASANSPVLKLGEAVGSTVALDADHISTGDIYTQVSTNAAGGAIVRLKSNAASCGGLLRAGAAPGTCNIAPALTGGITAGQAKFGVKVDAAADTGSNPNGTFQPVTGSGYNDTTYALNYASGDATGVTSAFGDPFLDTNGAPANNKNMKLTFGASVANNTPAGLYSADLSLIASGKF